MWSVGVLLYTLIAGHPPFEGRSNEELYQKIVSGDYVFSGREWDNYPEVKDLISHLLMFDAAERYESAEAINHPFFKATE
jgi:calcium-dependent protein kinase